MVRNITTPVLIKQIILWQWLITFCIAASLFVVKRELAVTALLGGMISALPNMYFARQLFTKRKIAAAGLLLRTIYIAEFIKLGLAIALMAIVLINYKGVHPITLFVTYFIAHSCIWAVPLIKQLSSNQKLKQI